MLFWAVVSDPTEEAVELFPTREEAEAIVRAWGRDELGQAGAANGSPHRPIALPH